MILYYILFIILAIVIVWLSVSGIRDARKKYRTLKTEQERSQYRNDFIMKCALFAIFIVVMAVLKFTCFGGSSSDRPDNPYIENGQQQRDLDNIDNYKQNNPNF